MKTFNKWLWPLMLVLLSGVAHGTNKQTKLEYKCHFELTGGQELVHYVVSQAKKTTSVAAKMRGKLIFAKDGKTKLRVNKVIECVSAKGTFKALKSQQLDVVTLS
jgi:hypothetical protein